MNIPDEVIEEAARIAWADEPGATIAEFDQLNPVGRAELLDTARKSARVIAEWARKEALKEIAAVRADAPKCDIYADDEPVSCGWKRTVQAIDAILGAPRG